MTSKQGLWMKTKKRQSKPENLMETEDKNMMDITGVEGKGNKRETWLEIGSWHL